MQSWTPFTLIASLALGSLFVPSIHALPGPRVETKHGIITGFKDATAPEVAQFYGIPYAEAPIRERRWLPALPKESFGTLDASVRRPSCPQTDPPGTGGAWAAEFLIRPNSTSEDCLTLNIWTPANSSKALPVVVWIHGGGFGAVSYRVGLWGFPNAAGLELTQQNLGLLDQRLATEWVRDNIAQFGGDPERIVLWGQSAGAASVSYYQYAYSDDPIAISFVKDSGSPFIPIGSTDAVHGNFSSLAAAFGCQEEELNCLREVPFRKIQKYLDQAGNLTFNVIVDEKTKFSDYENRTLDGKVAKGVSVNPIQARSSHIDFVIGKPSIVGSTRDEWNFAGSSTIPPTNGSDVVPDNLFGCPAQYETSLRNIAGLKTYRYMYSSNFTNIMPGGQGAFHSAELPLIFGTHDIARQNSTEFEYEVSEEMQDLWLSFIIDPEDGPVTEGWEATPLGGLETLQTGIDIGYNGSVVQPFSWSSWQTACVRGVVA
ncbi:uncharacterized protein N0V96_007467 [Colletotrichum fioriniae]|uniref:uncharacterized protein n=1 Tax=Colletotrichum fioriniae TaxID=710243 RepID=UPI0032DB4C5B|nr:hypothetical protein N0V96_007467 [Colletotrichum fioriniae]